jgi:hypothetical protein
LTGSFTPRYSTKICRQNLLVSHCESLCLEHSNNRVFRDCPKRCVVNRSFHDFGLTPKSTSGHLWSIACLQPRAARDRHCATIWPARERHHSHISSADRHDRQIASPAKVLSRDPPQHRLLLRVTDRNSLRHWHLHGRRKVCIIQ